MHLSRVIIDSPGLLTRVFFLGLVSCHFAEEWGFSAVSPSILFYNCKSKEQVRPA